MYQIKDIIRYLERYDIGVHSAKQLRTALLKRIHADPTEAFIRALTPDKCLQMIERYGAVSRVRADIDAVLSTWMNAEIPLSEPLFTIFSRLDWLRITTHVERILQNERDKTSVKIKNNPGIDL